MDDLTDEQFINYCDAMTTTQRCVFAPSAVARLCRLAGCDETVARRWDNAKAQVYNMEKDGIVAMVARARVRAAKVNA